MFIDFRSSGSNSLFIFLKLQYPIRILYSWVFEKNQKKENYIDHRLRLIRQLALFYEREWKKEEEKEVKRPIGEAVHGMKILPS